MDEGSSEGDEPDVFMTGVDDTDDVNQRSDDNDEGVDDDTGNVFNQPDTDDVRTAALEGGATEPTSLQAIDGAIVAVCQKTNFLQNGALKVTPAPDMGFRGRAGHDPGASGPRGSFRLSPSRLLTQTDLFPSRTPPLHSRAQFQLLFQLRTGVCAARHPCRKVSALRRSVHASLVDHLFECPATRSLRDLHGVHHTSDLWAKPAECVAYALAFLATSPPPLVPPSQSPPAQPGE